MKKIGVGIVTYNRKLLFIECLNSLLNQSLKPDSIYILDNNSNDGTSEYIIDNFFKNQKINFNNWQQSNELKFLFYKKLDKNGGSSLGFYELTKKIHEDGFEWLLITDDDVIFEKDYLKNIFEKVKNSNKKIFLSYMVNNFNDLKIKGTSPLFAGGVISREIFDLIGFPVKDYFIYWDDVEFIIRYKKINIEEEIVENAFCIHDQSKLYKNYQIKKVNFFGKVIEFSNVSQWKIYYAYRNMVITLLKHKKYLELFIKIIKSLAKVILQIFWGEFYKSYLILYGLKDGFLNKRGKNERLDYSK